MSSPNTITSRSIAPPSIDPDASRAGTCAEPRIDTRTWFAHHRVIEIDHHGTIYRLRCTAQGKLILTK
jgi:hemin uptake protein HemP